MYIERGDIWYSSAIDVIVVVFFCSFVYVNCNFALTGWFFNCFNIIILYSYGKTVNENVQNVVARFKLA